MYIFDPLLVTTILFLTILCLTYLYYFRSFKYWSIRNVRSPKPSLPFGNFNRKMMSEAGMIIRDIYNELKKTGAEYGGYYMLAMPFFIPLTPDLNKKILITNFHCFQDRGIYYDEENDPLSAHIVALQGPAWKFIRNKLSPCFSSLKLKMMFPIMKKCSSDILDTIQEAEKIDIYDISTRYTTDLICSCAFGIEENSLKNPDSKFRENGKKLIVELSHFDSMRFVFGLMAPQILNAFNICFFDPKLTKFFYHIVQETIEYRTKNNVKRIDLMDSLIRLMNNEDLENGTNNNKDADGLTVNQIAAQVFLFYIAGFETSAMSITFCLYELAKRPDMQQKVREEILNAFEENDGELTYEAVNNMSYTEKVILETMRMYPPVSMLNRIVTKSFRVPNSTLTLDEGTRVVISALGIHHDSDFYPQPELFDPERFSEEEKAKRPPCTYLPFGDGPRICIGHKLAMIEIKLALAEFLRNYEYSIHPTTRTEIRMKFNGNLLGLKDKIWLKPTRI